MNNTVMIYVDRLSAFVAKCFHEAQEFIPVDDAQIAKTLHWMIRYQAPNGSFLEPGRVLHTAMQVHTTIIGLL